MVLNFVSVLFAKRHEKRSHFERAPDKSIFSVMIHMVFFLCLVLQLALAWVEGWPIHPIDMQSWLDQTRLNFEPGFRWRADLNGGRRRLSR